MTDPNVPLSEQEIQDALAIARELIDAGIPVFAAQPNPRKAGTYFLPKAWEKITPSVKQLERWRPGWALAAIGGHAADFLDADPRSGGDVSYAELQRSGHLPRSFGQQCTPSGGTHDVISATNERKAVGFMPGLDLQAGAPDGEGRGFIYISPTVRPSKAADSLGELRPYRWVHRPDADLLREFRGSDDSVHELVARVRASRSPSQPVSDDDPFITASEATRVDRPRSFTLKEAQDFVRPFLVRLAEAKIGEIEERCNAAAATLSHFVPNVWSVDQATNLLKTQLAHTAYDPNGPSDWDVSKFVPVLNGSRPVRDPWKAELREDIVEQTPLEAVAVEGDEVDALIAEMLKPSEVAQRPAPRYLIHGLLNFDSESWIIGEPGSKKSFVALDMAGHVANGRMWQGRKVHQAGVVIIVAEGAGGLGPRINAWEKVHGPMGENVWILPRPVQAANASAWRVLVEACRRLRPGLVIADTQARVTVGLKENDATDMGIYVHAVAAIREATGACVLSVHHTGRNGGDARGSSALDGAQHTELKVIAEGLKGKLKTEKQKDLPGLPDMPLTFIKVDLGLDEEGDPISSLVLSADPYEEKHNEMPDEPEEWETGHGPVIVQLFKVLRDQGGEGGLTKAEARTAIIHRFLHGDRKKLNPSTYYTAWDRGQRKASRTGEPVMVRVDGAKWTVDVEALKNLEEGTYEGNGSK